MKNSMMQPQGLRLLAFVTLLILGSYFLVQSLIAATGFLIPYTISLLLTLICIPLARKLEGWGWHRGLASITCVLLAFVIFISFFGLISLQISQLSDRWAEISKKAEEGLEQVEEFVSARTGFSFQSDIDDIFSEKIAKTDSSGAAPAKEPASDQSSSGKSEPGERSFSNSLISQVPLGMFTKVGGAVAGFFGFLANSTLAMIYLFFLLFYRRKIKLSILKFFSEENQENVREVLSNLVTLAKDFLVGRLLLILFLGIIYSIGLSISGVDNAVLISILAALLTLIPYVGNIIGFGLAIFMSVVSGGELGMYIGVIVTYSLAQFIESYILQPYILGGKVNINPIASIMMVVIGGSIWGIAGMILAIPLTGIAKIVCDAIPVLKPVGYLLGEEDLK
ncbi:AI-2E family transporter [Algoriphagus namhaensis]